MYASLTIQRNVPKACNTCICCRHYNKAQRSIVGIEREKNKEGTRAISPALKLCQTHRSLGEAIFVTYGIGESWPLCLAHRSLCLQPAGIPVFHRLWGRTILQWPGLSALPPLLCHLCWYPLPQSFRVFFWLWFGLYLFLAITHANPLDMFKANAREAYFFSTYHVCLCSHWKSVLSSLSSLRNLKTPVISPSLSKRWAAFGKSVQFKTGFFPPRNVRKKHKYWIITLKITAY